MFIILTFYIGTFLYFNFCKRYTFESQEESLNVFFVQCSFSLSFSWETCFCSRLPSLTVTFTFTVRESALCFIEGSQTNAGYQTITFAFDICVQLVIGYFLLFLSHVQLPSGETQGSENY